MIRRKGFDRFKHKYIFGAHAVFVSRAKHAARRAHAVFVSRAKHAARRNHFVQCLSGSHIYLVVSYSYVSQVTHAFHLMLPLCSQ